ncbi:hypothetical protein Aboo_1356 [Aciduliprofundum boonei T469]|uniref:Uncharacterized protein n=1 Tax=Aciduliprofundum boonei (strain DSM 19572 / T469) TaxID=439481 RepID=D3TAN5_ACIB4|nr:hypothetical protein Aboo_1356 [Aciduliprofundum boonei T469]
MDSTILWGFTILFFVGLFLMPTLLTFYYPRIRAYTSPWVCRHDPHDFNYYGFYKWQINYKNIVASYYCKLPKNIFRRVWLKVTLLMSIMIYLPLFVSFSASIAYMISIGYLYLSVIWAMIILWILSYYSADLLDRAYKKCQEEKNKTQK